MPQRSGFRSFGLPLLGAVGIAAVAAFTPNANAQLGGSIWASDYFVVVNASSANGSGSYVVNLGDASIFDGGNQYYLYSNTFNQPIGPGGNIAELVSLDVYAGIVQQPDGNYRWGINMTFTVKAGSADTHIEILSPVIGFSTLTGITDATTSATLGGTDQNANGISITGMGGGGTFGFASLLNANSLPNNFANVSSAVAGSTMYRSYFSGNQNSGVGGDSIGRDGNMFDLPIGNPNLTGISTIQSLFSFEISANDDAGGTSDFSVPAPATGALLALGGLLAARRRR